MAVTPVTFSTIAEGRGQVDLFLADLSELLGLGRNFNSEKVFEAIADLKDKATNSVGCVEALKKKVEILDAIAAQLGVEFTGNTEQIHKAIANLKHSLQLSQNEADELREKTVVQRVGEALGFSPTAPFDTETICIAASSILRLKNELQATVSHQSRRILELESCLGDISDLLGFNRFHAGQISDQLKNLQEKAAIADQIQSELKAIAQHLLIKFTGDINEIHAAITDLIKYSLRDSDRDELNSERSYYREILDKLCDRLGVDTIEELEDLATNKIDLYFRSPQSKDLHNRLAESQATSYKYVGRIIELENELRSLNDPEVYASKIEYRKYLSEIAEILGVNYNAFKYEDLPRRVEAWAEGHRNVYQLIEDLREQLASCRAVNLHYMNHIVALENEARSLKEPVNTVGRGDRHEYKIKFLENGEILRVELDEPFPDEVQGVGSDRLTPNELVQVIRALLK